MTMYDTGWDGVNNLTDGGITDVIDETTSMILQPDTCTQYTLAVTLYYYYVIKFRRSCLSLI